MLTDTTLKQIEYRGFIIQPQEIASPDGNTVRCAYAVLYADGRPTGMLLRAEETAKQHINSKIARAQNVVNEALAREMARQVMPTKLPHQLRGIDEMLV